MRYALVAVLGLGAFGCVDQGSGPLPKKVDPTIVQSHLLGAVPSDPGFERLDLKVGDVAIYLGNRVDRPRVAPGQVVTITHYWKVLKPVDAKWSLFALVRGPANTPDFMNLLPTDMEIAHGPTVWQQGEIIEDVQAFTVRPDWRSASATVLVGFVEVGKHGPLDRMPVTGPRAIDNAIVARVLDIDLSRAPPPKGTAYIPRANGPIAIDGVGQDVGWAGAVQTELVTAEGGADPIGKAVAKMTWDDTYLYVFVSVTDSDIVSPYKKHDDPLWKADCVELFIDADGNKRGYVELQVGPNNTTFDSWFSGGRAPSGDEAWDSEMVTAVKLRGTTEAGDTDQGWDAEIGIPWAAVKGRDEQMKIHTPPEIGDRWRLNVVRVDRKSTDNLKGALASSWNRITMGDFHALDRMLTVVFADSTGSIVPNAPPLDNGSGAGSGSNAGSGNAGSGSNAGSGAGTGSNAGNGNSDGSASSNGSGNSSGSGNSAGSGSGSGSGTAAFGSGAGPRIRQRIDGAAVSLVLEVAANGGVTINGKSFDDSQLDNLFRAVFARDKETPIVIRADKTVPQTRIVKLLDAAKRAGLTHLSIGAVTSAQQPLTAGGTMLEVPSGATSLAQSASLVIVVMANGNVMIGGKQIPDAELDRVLREAAARSKDTRVIIQADKNAQYGRVVGLMDRAKQAGLTRIAIGTAP